MSDIEKKVPETEVDDIVVPPPRLESAAVTAAYEAKSLLSALVIEVSDSFECSQLCYSKRLHATRVRTHLLSFRLV
jgi:hypothetical protein